MLGIIRVLTTDDDAILNEHGRRMNQYLGIHTVTKCIHDQPKGIYDDETEKTAIPKIVDLAEQMVKSYDLEAITISCAADPALVETRKAVSVPVFGAGISGAHAAALVGSKVGIIGITEEPPNQMVKQLGDFYHSHIYSPHIRKTTDLFSNDAKEELMRLCHEVIGNGADVLLFGCTGFSTIQLKHYLIKHVDVPIIDLVEAQAVAYHLMKKEG